MRFSSRDGDVKEVRTRAGKFRLQRLEEEHLQEVLEIERASFQDPWPFVAFSRELENPFAKNTVALDENGRVAGYTVAWRAGPEFHLLNIAVRPDVRRHGLGKELMRNVLKQARDEGAEYVVLEVRPSNSAAIALYKSLGFVTVAVRRRYYSDGEDAEVMICLL